MSAPGTTAKTIVATPVNTTLWGTILADLSAGETWFATEAETVGLSLWNLLKGAFIALAPGEMTILQDLLTKAVSDAAAGKSIEEIFSDALNLASTEELALLQKAGSGIGLTLVSAIKAKVAATPTA